MSDLSRRSFLGQSAAATTWAMSASLAAAPSERLTVALIGCGGMGSNHLQLLAARQDSTLRYLCDCDSTRLATAAKSIESQVAVPPTLVSDLRNVLDDPEVDAVWIATPDHWHAPATLLALAAGKHVYVEKPCSHNIREGRLMVDAARKAKRVVQVGTQSRSTPHVMEAMQLLRDGVIGDVLVAKAWNSQLRRNIGKTQPSDPPPHLDYDLWLGPAPLRPYRSNMLPGVWRFWREYGCGDIGNDGVHDIDIARWGLGVDTHPSLVSGLGTKLFFDDDQQFPDSYFSVFEYPGDGNVGHIRQLIYEQRDWSPYFQEGAENGNAFYGTKGLMLLHKSGGYQVFGPRNKLIREGTGRPDTPAHHQNFVDCIRSGGTPHADIAVGHLSATLCHLANISTKLTQTLTFDPEAETFPSCPEARELLSREYRPGHWAAPTDA
ncbi:MAG: Gfo/Idh/MocA family oxidoreductase [Planctomycetaceae bacterium]|nr:Gfo/Idh/MocA family oxidoreductase [Planctomycetaceae bacterium]